MLAHYLQGFSLQLGLELYLVGYRHRLTDFAEKMAGTVRIVVTLSSDIGTVQGSDTTDTYFFADTSPGIKKFVVDGKSPLPPQPEALGHVLVIATPGCYRRDSLPWYLRPFSIHYSTYILRLANLQGPEEPSEPPRHGPHLVCDVRDERDHRQPLHL
jgi:hypothetical protein